MNTEIPMFYRKFQLLKNTPTTNSGTIFHWDLWRELYTSKHSLLCDHDGVEETFKKEDIEKLQKWFRPVGDPSPFYRRFPDDLSEHFYFGELLHNQMCRFCTIAQDVIDSDEFRVEVTAALRRLYEAKLNQLIQKN